MDWRQMNYFPNSSNKRNRPAVSGQNLPVLLLAVAFVVTAILFIIVLSFVFQGNPARTPTPPRAMAVEISKSTARPIAVVPSPTPPPTQPPPPAHTDGPMNIVCMYQVQPGDGLARIMQGFRVYYVPANKYYSRDCESKDGMLSCGLKQQIGNNNSIFATQWIEIQGLDQVDCMKYGGVIGIVPKE